MGFACKLCFHRWLRVGITKPIRRQSDFVEREYIGHKAMGLCVRCKVTALRNVMGYWQWYHSDEVTEDEYKKGFDSGEYREEESDIEL